MSPTPMLLMPGSAQPCLPRYSTRSFARPVDGSPLQSHRSMPATPFRSKPCCATPLRGTPTTLCHACIAVPVHAKPRRAKPHQALSCNTSHPTPPAPLLPLLSPPSLATQTRPHHSIPALPKHSPAFPLRRVPLRAVELQTDFPAVSQIRFPT